MVFSWLSGSIPNEGFLLVSSDELRSTGSGFTLKFFSRDTNTIYSPYLDAMWMGNGASTNGENEFVTGSISTGSVTITTVSSGMNVTVQTGSTFSIAGGVNGIFSGSIFLVTGIHYVTTSNSTIDLNVSLFTGSFSGSVNGSATYVSGTLSGSGWFTSSYFSGSIDGTDYEYIDTGISSSLVNGIISGSLNTTGSIGIFIGEITSSNIYLSGIVTGVYFDTFNVHINGIVNGAGLSGNIKGMPVIGNYDGYMSASQEVVTGSCGSSFLANMVYATLTNGMFSGSSFTAYYTDDQKFENAHLTGSWSMDALLGTTITVPLPSGIEPFAYAYAGGNYIHGKALGTYVISGSDSASFYGQFVNGLLKGGYLNVQLSGSVFTSSYQYTSSIEFTSSNMTALNISNPFTIITQNVRPIYKAGDIAKIKVFARKQFPLKSFGISSQQEQYLVPEYLPTSSYYALKDNETGEIVLDFDDYTQLSCGYPYGNYFVIDTSGMPQERHYRVLIRVKDGQSIYTTDCGKIFKITR